MNLLFTYIVTALLVVLGLLSLGHDFTYTPLYIILALVGLAVSFWQHKKQPLPYLRALANIVLLALTVKALFPFFIGKPKYDMFTALIATWIYFLVISTYIIRIKRDFYIVQGLSLGLIVYSCFYATHNPLRLLGYTTLFLVLWIMALRNINLFPDPKEKTIPYTVRDIWREIKLGAVLFLAIVFVSLPLYFLLPRFNIPLLPMDQLLRQRYSAIYSDFPKRGLVIYLSRNPKDIMSEKRESEGETPSPTPQGGKQSQIELTPQVTKPVFWHAEEDIEKYRKRLKENEEKLQDIAKKENLEELDKDVQERKKLHQQEEKIKQQKKEAEKALQKSREDLQKVAQSQANLRQDLPKDAPIMKELADRAKSLKDQAQKLENQLKELKAQLQKVEEQKEQVLQAVEKQAESLANPEVQRLVEEIKELEKQIKALSQQIENLEQQQRQQELQLAEEQAKAAEAKPELKPEAKAEPKPQSRNQEEINKLKEKIQKTEQELRELAQQNNLSDVEKNLQAYQKLVTQEEKISQAKKELEKSLERSKEDYLKMAQAQSNPSPALAGNPAALKELGDKMKSAENKIQNMGDERRAMDKQLDKIEETINRMRDSIYRGSAQTTQKVRILWDKREEQQQELKELEDKGKSSGGEGQGRGPQEGKKDSFGQDEESKGTGEKSGDTGESEEDEFDKPGDKKSKSRQETKEEKKTRQVTILDIILYTLLLITIIYVIRTILAFVLPYIRHKRRIQRASHHSQYNLSVSLIYNFLGRVLYIFGYRYPVVMVPEDYLKAMSRRFAAISHYTQDLTALFIEARYSSHRLKAEQEKQAFENYRNILQELKNTGAAWQRHLLKIRFLFEL